MSDLAETYSCVAIEVACCQRHGLLEPMKINGSQNLVDGFKHVCSFMASILPWGFMIQFDYRIFFKWGLVWQMFGRFLLFGWFWLTPHLKVE